MVGGFFFKYVLVFSIKEYASSKCLSTINTSKSSATSRSQSGMVSGLSTSSSGSSKAKERESLKKLKSNTFEKF